jgi:hypothetical protein
MNHGGGLYWSFSVLARLRKSGARRSTMKFNLSGAAKLQLLATPSFPTVFGALNVRYKA